MSRPELPRELLLGKVHPVQPVYAFTSDAHAIHWLEREKDGLRFCWRVRVEVVTEVELVRSRARLEDRPRRDLEPASPSTEVAEEVR